jgi:hypothetical protein
MTTSTYAPAVLVKLTIFLTEEIDERRAIPAAGGGRRQR